MPATDPSPDLWANLGVLLAAGVAALTGYFGPKIFSKTPPNPLPKSDAVVASVGLELGNRLQMDQVIVQLCRIADALENKKQADLVDMLKELRGGMREVKEEIDDLRDDQRRR